VTQIPADEEISIYKQGDCWTCCTGPHLPSTGKLGKAFSCCGEAGALLARRSEEPAAPAHLRHRSSPDRSMLKDYLVSSKRRRSATIRRLGREMGLFHQQEEAVGAIFWHPKAWRLYRKLESYIRRRLDATGYQEVKTPQILDRSLWERSGHWENSTTPCSSSEAARTRPWR